MKIKIQRWIYNLVFFVSHLFGTDNKIEKTDESAGAIKVNDNKTLVTTDCCGLEERSTSNNTSTDLLSQNLQAQSKRRKRKQVLIPISDELIGTEYFVLEFKKPKIDENVTVKCGGIVLYSINNIDFCKLHNQDKINLLNISVCKVETDCLSNEDDIIRSLDLISATIYEYLHDLEKTYFKKDSYRINMFQFFQSVREETKKLINGSSVKGEKFYKDELTNSLESEDLDIFSLAVARYFIYLYLNITEIDFESEFINLHNGINNQIFDEYAKIEKGCGETWVFSVITPGKKHAFKITPYTRLIIAFKRLKGYLNRYYDVLLLTFHSY